MAAIAYAISNAPPPPSGFGARHVFAVDGIPADRFDFGGGADALAPGESSDPLDLIWVVVGGTVDEATLWTSSRSLVAPLTPALAPYFASGAVVRGTAADDIVLVGARATDVRGGKGNDILYWDPDTGGAARMVRMDGQGDVDTYVIGATTDAATAATSGGQILDFIGPGVGRRDEVLLGDLDAETVTAQVEGRYIHFFDGSYHLRLEFLDQNNNALTHERIASMVRFGPESVELAAADFFII